MCLIVVMQDLSAKIRGNICLYYFSSLSLLLHSSFNILYVYKKILLFQNTGETKVIESYRWFAQWLIPKILAAVKVALIILM